MIKRRRSRRKTLRILLNQANIKASLALWRMWTKNSTIFRFQFHQSILNFPLRSLCSQLHSSRLKALTLRSVDLRGTITQLWIKKKEGEVSHLRNKMDITQGKITISSSTTTKINLTTEMRNISIEVSEVETKVSTIEIIPSQVEERKPMVVISQRMIFLNKTLSISNSSNLEGLWKDQGTNSLHFILRNL